MVLTGQVWGHVTLEAVQEPVSSHRPDLKATGCGGHRPHPAKAQCRTPGRQRPRPGAGGSGVSVSRSPRSVRPGATILWGLNGSISIYQGPWLVQ